MSQVELLTRAIGKLETLKAESTIAPWSVDELPETGECRIIRMFDFFGTQIEEVTGGRSIRPDAVLIVTLHRTIDAQLALLRNVTEVYGVDKTPRGLFMASENLARAILGDDV